MLAKWMPCGCSDSSVAEWVLVRVLVFLTGVSTITGAQWEKLSDEQNKDVAARCYGLGACMPQQEPSGGRIQICQIFEESVVCLDGSVAACRMLKFPEDILRQSEAKIRELRHELRIQCADIYTTVRPHDIEEIPEEEKETELYDPDTDDLGEDRPSSGGVTVVISCWLLMAVSLIFTLGHAV